MSRAEQSPSIWDDGVYGMFFEGREVMIHNPVRYIDSSSKIIILGPFKDDKVGLFLEKYGFRAHATCAVEDNETAVKNAVRPYVGDSNAVFLLTRDAWWKKYRHIFEECGVACQLLSMMKIFFIQMRPRLREVYDMLDDNESREVFTTVLNVRFRLQETVALYPYCQGNPYFILPQMRCPTGKEVFVDCGAFVGDTIENFLKYYCVDGFGKAYAFEPAPKQYRALVKRTKRLVEEWALDEKQIVCIPAGVGNHTMKAKLVNDDKFGHFNLAGIRLEESETPLTEEDAVDVYALDDILAQEDVSFIKADIEGFEMDMLRGAERIIRTRKPLMAICIYHKLTDYYEIPLYLKKLVPEYKMKVRHHSTSYGDTVLYCYL
ncbi:MAG: FkbM family methyltransferase [Fretibacterium sp.]|nr:FkbM family methyltransferase [Fretibacterium sp.]